MRQETTPNSRRLIRIWRQIQVRPCPICAAHNERVPLGALRAQGPLVPLRAATIINEETTPLCLDPCLGALDAAEAAIQFQLK